MFREYARIQNSMFGLIVLSQNIYSGSLAIQYYKATNPKKPSDIKKGDKIYDYNNGGFFSLNIFEAKEILLYLTAVTRKYNFDAPVYELTHFPNNGAVHKLILTPNKDKKTVEIALVYIVNKKLEKSVKLIMSRSAVEVFMDFLSTYKDVVTMKNMLNELRYKPKNNNDNNFNQGAPGNNQPNRNNPNQDNPDNNPNPDNNSDNPIDYDEFF